MNALQRICAARKKRVEAQKEQVPLCALEKKVVELPQARGFIQAIHARQSRNVPALIAEIKKASPSAGDIRNNFDPAQIARAYEESGAACLSVLTEPDFFKGGRDDLVAARNACNLPVLRKDFILEPYQVLETRAIGADCILLIVAALEDNQIKELYSLAQELGLDVLLEVHNEPELRRALEINPKMIGINNRNLKTLKIDINVSLDLAHELPTEITKVSESGIRTVNDMRACHDAGFHACLVGESLLAQENLDGAVKKLLGTS